MMCIQPTHPSHEALAQDVTGFRHSGHCSAANTTLPPFFSVVALLLFPPPLEPPPHAAATSAIANRTVSQRR
jgi:hypothetical protein